MSFNRLESSDFLISAESITAAVWSGYQPTLTNFFTSSTQESSNAGSYYLDVYQTSSLLSGSEVQYSIAYGNKTGSGSITYNTLISGSSPTRTVYGQYRNLILGDENTDFNFGGTVSNELWVISVERARYKERLMPGSFNLNLSGSQTIKLTDNSGDSSVISYKDSGRVYDIVSGSNGRAVSTAYFSGITAGYTPSGSYGWFLPDVGLIVLNPKALGLSAASGGIGTPTVTTYNTNTNNNRLLYRVISGSSSFKINSEETLTSDYVFVRVKNSEFNYSTNPSFISGSTGEVVYSNFVNSPQTYLTTVGLYNDNNDLLAVAKMSKPLSKNFTNEALLRLKLDF